MKISELAAATGVSVPTLKYYLREGLLPAGASRGATRAEYDDTHVARVRLVRALIESGRLSIAKVHTVVAALEDPPATWHDLLGTAQATVIAAEPDAAPDGERDRQTDRVARLLERLGWQVPANCPAAAELGRALAGAAAAGVLDDDAVLDDYAAAMAQVAAVDVASVPDHPEDAVRQVIVGTVLVQPVLRALRLLAQQDASARRFAGRRAP
ncbi:MAG TPA: MerR family transcriptional regulator [Segeticoccus sp.]|uniref:MerR family transcriptional regulator n=1 Tax=Segeticoccus sp. TaxID=2706531 RepID=UPI002D7EEAAA|nr:MerR family transcriptional regulator [Segeticoccus sp.]HET8601599.1 MerR family transcriptional regulator [Segeticoccus sp.]